MADIIATVSNVPINVEVTNTEILVTVAAGQTAAPVIPFGQTVTSALTGGDFTTIQGAIDSITVGAGERYVVLIYPGTYTENVTLKDGVSLRGAGGAGDAIIRATSGDVLTLGTGTSTVEQLVIQLDVTGSDTPRAVVGAGAGSFRFSDVTFDIDAATARLSCIDISDGDVTFESCVFQYDQAGVAGGDHIVMAVSGTATATLLDGLVQVDVGAVAGADEVVFCDYTGAVDEAIKISAMLVEMAASSASYAGDVEFLRVTGASVDHYVKNCHVHLQTPSGSPGSTGTGYLVNNGAAGVQSTANLVRVTGFNTNYFARMLFAGDAVSSHFDESDTDDEVTGPGSLVAASSTTAGDLQVSGAIYNSTAAAAELVLQGTPATDLGTVKVRSPVTFQDMVAGGVGAVLSYPETFTRTASLIGGFISLTPDVTVSTAVFIWSTLTDQGVYRQAIAPGFASYTMFNVLSKVTNDGDFNLLNALVLNVGLQHERNTSGTSTVGTTVGLSFAPQTRTTAVGAIMTRTDGMTAVSCSPTFSTIVFSTVNMGTVVGLACNQPAVALFQTADGTETLDAYYGVDFAAMTYPTTNEIAVIRSAMTDSASRYFLLNDGGARSDMGGGLLLDCGTVQVFADNAGLSLGAGGGDVLINWNGVALEYDPAVGEDLRWVFAVGSHTLQSGQFGTNSELRLGFDRFAFGQTSAIANQVGVFVAPTRTTSVNGGWSDFLLTQGGNITVNHTIGQLAGWTINSPSITLGTGSVTDAIGLLIGGNPSQGTNRYGLLVLSNPAGGTLNYCARFQGAAGVRIDGDLEHNGTNLGLYGATPVAQSAAYTRNATVVEDRTLLASASATTLNNNNLLAALIADLQATGIIG